ncbi:discoidin domain-containing protein [Pelobacter seleniigenes]|uniref:discoidin domain-containing protein n=1 Tax=Pelobacter seleniigenes TaxID=407188 RepID=UPI0004A76C56|nr:discoidin domain-containing protein [Pelobacter seleniigenes]
MLKRGYRLFILGLVLLLAGLLGCDGDDNHTRDSAGEGDSNLSTVTAGVAVDPYIIGALFFEDKNNNGLQDEGEQLSTVTDENGYFSFAEPLTIGSTLVMKDPGTHQGLPFTLILKRQINAEDAGQVVVSPLTTLLAAGLSADELLTLLSDAGLPWAAQLQPADLSSDPLAAITGLSAGQLTDDDLALLRTDFVAYSVMEFMNRFSPRELTAERIAAALDSEDFSQLLFDTVELLCSKSMLEDADLDLAGRAAGMPALTMDDLATTIPAILYWWTGQFYEDLINNRYDFPVIDDIAEQLGSFVLALAPYNYALHRLDNPAVTPADFLAAELLPLAADSYVMLANDGSQGVRLVSNEISLTDETFQDRSYVFGGAVLHFSATGDWRAISAEDGVVDLQQGTWSRTGNDVQLVDNTDSAAYTLTLVGEWPEYLRFMTTDPVLGDERSGVMNLPLAKVRQFDSSDLAGRTFLIDDDDCLGATDFCGGRVVFGAYDAENGLGTATLYMFDADNTAPVVADWRFAEDDAVVIETADETSELYFYGDDGNVVVVTSQGDTVIDVAGEKMFPPDIPEAIGSGVYTVASTVGEELTLYAGNQYSWNDGTQVESGTLNYDSATGELTLSSGEAVSVRIWFYGVAGETATEFPFYYEDYDGGTVVASGFDKLIYKEAAPVQTANLALNKSVSALTNTQQGLPEYVTDGDVNTWWYSYQGVNNSCQFVVDLGAEYSIGEVVLGVLQTEEMTLESSVDGTDWTTRHQQSGLWLTTTDPVLSFPVPFSARYLRYTGHNAQTAWIGMKEIEVFAP